MSSTSPRTHPSSASRNINSCSDSTRKRRGRSNCSVAASRRDLISPVSPSSRRTRSSRSAIASSGGSPGKNESPAANCVYSLTGSLNSSRSQVEELLAARASDLVDRPLGTPPLAYRLSRHDEPLPLQRPYHRVQRAVPEPHRLVLAPLTHQSNHLVRVHRPLVEKRHHRQCQRIGYLPLRRHSYSLVEIV